MVLIRASSTPHSHRPKISALCVTKAPLSFNKQIIICLGRKLKTEGWRVVRGCQASSPKYADMQIGRWNGRTRLANAGATWLICDPAGWIPNQTPLFCAVGGWIGRKGAGPAAAGGGGGGGDGGEGGLTVKCQHWHTTRPCVFGHRCDKKKKKSDQCSKEAQQEIIRSSFLKSREYLGSWWVCLRNKSCRGSD